MNIPDKVRPAAQAVRAFFKWTALAVPTGVIVGLAGAGFSFALRWAAHTRGAHPWLIWLLPLGGLAIAALYHLARLPQGLGTDYVLLCTLERKPVSALLAPLIFLSTALTHLLGGSAGREGAALQMGSSLAGALGRLLRLREGDVETMAMCGMAAGFSALFGAPLTAAVFALEVMTVGVMHYAAWFPCLTASLTGHLVSTWCGVEHASFRLDVIPPLDPQGGVRAAALGALCGLLAIGCCLLLEGTRRLYETLWKNPWLRIAAGGCVVTALTLLVGTQDYSGAGEGIILRAIQGEALPHVFALKMLFTALTLGAGYKGGEIVPVLSTGAAFGCVVAPLLGLSPSLGAVLGMAGLFCGVTNCPITVLFLSCELFGPACLPYAALCTAVSYLLSGYVSLYHQQRIAGSKYILEGGASQEK